jgi:hypothetical protein
MITLRRDSDILGGCGVDRGQLEEEKIKVGAYI